MKAFADQVASTLIGLDSLESVALKVASDATSNVAQKGACQVSNMLYETLQCKTAEVAGTNNVARWCNLVSKMASARGKRVPDDALLQKIAAVVLTDVAITRAYQAQPQYKYAEMRAYGREFMSHLLREVIL